MKYKVKGINCLYLYLLIYNLLTQALYSEAFEEYSVVVVVTELTCYVLFLASHVVVQPFLKTTDSNVIYM